MWRLVYEETGELYKKLGVPSVFVWYMRRAALPSLRAEGIGRHSLTEVTKIMEDDLHAISQILGNDMLVLSKVVQTVHQSNNAKLKQYRFSGSSAFVLFLITYSLYVKKLQLIVCVQNLNI